MTLTVLNVAYPLALVTPESVGGAEQVLAAVDAALVEHGATSIVLACEGSRVAGQLLSTPAPNGILDDEACFAARRQCAVAITEALDRFPIDVVHLHGLDFHAYLPPAGVSVLATLHLAPSWYPPSAIAPRRPGTFVHCVSEWQHRLCQPSAALLPAIHNGVAIPATVPRRKHRSLVAALGRICPEKGFHIALDVARRANVPLTLAGQVFAYPGHVHYYETEILPRLSAERRFVGPLGRESKRALIAEARCVLVTSLVPETSSLVAMEAMASGTPVIAFGKGALVEVIEHGVTGFLVHDEQEMADAIVAVGELDPEACRHAAIERFSIEAMKRKYLERYHLLAHPVTEDSAKVGHAHSIALGSRRSVDTPLEIAEIDTVSELRALVAEWTRLCASSRTTPFQRPEWILPWWQHFGGGELRVVIVRRDGQLLGMAPLYLRTGSDARRELALIGSGNSDYVDVLAAESSRVEVATAIVGRIASIAADCETCDLGPLPAGSPLFSARLPNGWHAPEWRWDTCPVLSGGSPPNLLRAIPRRLVTQLQYERRRLAKDHALTIERADTTNALALFDALSGLHAARWRARGGNGMLSEERTRRFHADVVAGMARAGILRLSLLWVDDRPAAAFYGFADDHRWYYYLGGFNPELRRFSVGSLLILHALEEAAARGASAFDFLRGAEPYKYRWGAVDEAVYGWRLTRATGSAAGAAA